MNTTTTATLAAHWPQPGNRRDRERFAALTEWEQDVVRATAARLYDGTRTVARCWSLALDA
jgi:hypothetical protein